MSVPARRFAATKIQPPRPRPGSLIDRPALEQRLGQALLTHKLVLVSAAAGFGKTSALARQVQRLPAGTAVAWISCDEGDSTGDLLACLVAALEPFDPPWRVEPDILIESASRPGLGPSERRAIATEVINALAACEVPHGVIVVDDLHRIDRPEVHEFVNGVLERLAPHWTLCIATRGDPPLALARLRAQGQLAEFRLADLRFEADEARALFAQAGLDAAEAAALVARTQGWPVGLRLAINVLAGRSGERALAAAQWSIDRHVFDFLASEVLDRLEPALRDFLLRTSVLGELTAVRCAAVSGDAQAALRLEQIEREGLFVSVLAADEPVLRLHDLFRAALEQRLAREHPHELPQLLLRAAAGEADPLRKIALLKRAQAWPAAATLLREQAPVLLTAGVINDLARSLEGFPPEQIERLPDLHLAGVLLGWARWRWADMLRHAQAAIAGFEAAGRSADARLARAYRVIALRGSGQRDDSDAELEALQAELPAAVPARPSAGDGMPRELMLLVAVWRHFDAAQFGELPGLLNRQLDLLEQGGPPDLWYQCVPLPAYAGLAGCREPLLRYVHGVLARTDEGTGELRMLARGLHGSVRVWSGDVAGGVQALQDVAGEVRWRDYPLRATLHTHLGLSLGHALRGDRAAFRRDAQTLYDTLQRWGTDAGITARMGTEFYILARWMLGAGEHDWARSVFEQVQHFSDARERPVFRIQREPVAGYVAWMKGDHAGAARLFEQALQRVPVGLEMLGQASELRVRAGWARLRDGEPEAAAQLLRPLFARHADDADIAALLIPGPDILGDLARASWGDALGAGPRAALQHWADVARALRQPDRLGAPQTGAADTPPGGLSERELEVLQRMAAGDSNKLIARAFDLSPHTVKRHVANILDKLGLASRGQAAAWYREHA
ncbi:MAG: LuxR C-terminal-related transcriptional regulator [Rubrivivax sp.]